MRNQIRRDEGVRYLSLFSGIEAATVAWHPFGWEPIGFAEIEPFPCAVLAHHYPNVPNLGSVTEITDEQIAALGPIDLVVGGSPCQDLSVAGKRNGLAGERSGLFHEQIRIFNAARLLCGARWLVWENVPGAFSSNQGRDFAVVAGAMAGCNLDVPSDGWGTEGVALGEAGLVEWSVLDAQWFGVAQRRRRVFAILNAGSWADRLPILLERDGLRGDSPPCREQGKDLAPTIRAGAPNGGSGHGARGGDSKDELIVPVAPTAVGSATSALPPAIPHVAMCLNAGAMGRQDAESETLIPTLPKEVIAFAQNQRDEIRTMPYVGALAADPGAKQQTYVLETIAVHGTQDPDALVEQAHTLGRNQGQENVIVNPYTSVRRLTPRECERLQGFPDDYTRIEWRGKPAEQCPDGPRYKALGNSMAVPVMR